MSDRQEVVGMKWTVGTFLTSSDYSLDVEALPQLEGSTTDHCPAQAALHQNPKLFQPTDSLLELIMHPTVKMLISKPKYGTVLKRKRPGKMSVQCPSINEI